MKKLILATALTILASNADAQVQSQSSGLYYPAKFIALSSIGINCDGATDVSTALNAALIKYAGTWLDGENKTCAIAAGLNLVSHQRLQNVSILDTNANRANSRQFSTSGGSTATDIYLRNVSCNHNNGSLNGDVANDGCFWLPNITNSTFENIDITGDGHQESFHLSAGSGTCSDIIIRNMNLHDMKWSQNDDPGSEQINAIRISCSHVRVTGLRIKNILGNVIVGPYTQLTGAGIPNNIWIPYQGHCVAISAATDVSISDFDLSNCPTGVDISGSGTNSSIALSNGHLDTIGDWGIKVIHNALDVSIDHVTVVGAGFSDFVVTDGAAADVGGPNNVICNVCVAIDPGAPYNWGGGSGQLWAGAGKAFSALNVVGGHAMVGVRWINSVAKDDQVSATMTYGFSRDTTSMDVQIFNNRISSPITGNYNNFTADPAYASPNLALATAGTVAADNCPYFTSATASALTSCPTFGRSLMGAASSSAAQTALATFTGSNTYTGLQSFSRIAIPRQSLGTIANGLNSNIANGNNSFLILSGPTGAFSIGGFTTTADGLILRVYNSTAQQMTIVNNDASSTSGDRLLTMTGANVVCRTGQSFASFIYNGSSNVWLLQNSNC